VSSRSRSSPVFDRIEREGERVVYHYVIVDYLCRWRSGEAKAASDALDVAWATRRSSAGYDLPRRRWRSSGRLPEGARL